jgi:glycosyltransferase involved in cell wall biosynthesis
VRFSIVTPSLRQLAWLKRAVRSVADQGVELEHLIQDGGSGAELENWIHRQNTPRLVVETDSGMYDALNRGFSRATGDIWAWLNCDEQYLPGALAAVETEFAAHPETDVLLADNFIIDSAGRYLAHRFSLLPTVAQLWSGFPSQVVRSSFGLVCGSLSIHDGNRRQIGGGFGDFCSDEHASESSVALWRSSRKADITWGWRRLARRSRGASFRNDRGGRRCFGIGWWLFIERGCGEAELTG